MSSWCLQPHLVLLPLLFCQKPFVFPSPTLSPTDPVPRGLLTLCPWASSGPQARVFFCAPPPSFFVPFVLARARGLAHSSSPLPASPLSLARARERALSPHSLMLSFSLSGSLSVSLSPLSLSFFPFVSLVLPCCLSLSPPLSIYLCFPLSHSLARSLDIRAAATIGWELEEGLVSALCSRAVAVGHSFKPQV